MNPLSLVLLVLALAAVVYGCWLIYAPAGFIVGGVLVAVFVIDWPVNERPKR